MECVECVECLQSNVWGEQLVLSQHTSLWKHATQSMGRMHIVTETQHVSITHLRFTTPESLFTLLMAIGSGYKMGGCFNRITHTYTNTDTHTGVCTSTEFFQSVSCPPQSDFDPSQCSFFCKPAGILKYNTLCRNI